MEKKRILFIDNNKDIIDIFRRAFSDRIDVEIHFRRCLKAEDALKAIEEIGPDVLFLDHNLSPFSEGEGLEVAKVLKSKKREAKIYATSLLPEEEIKDLYGELLDGYVGKNSLFEIEERIKKI